MANPIDSIFKIPEINAIRWVQGMGVDAPVMQWVPFIQKIQAAGKSVVVDLQLSELESFIKECRPKGILLCIAADAQTQKDVIKRVLKWK